MCTIRCKEEKGNHYLCYKILINIIIFYAFHHLHEYDNLICCQPERKEKYNAQIQYGYKFQHYYIMTLLSSECVRHWTVMVSYTIILQEEF